MNIGIDIDGVLENLMDFISEYGIKYCIENKLPYTYLKKDEYNTYKMFGWSKETDDDFWMKNIFPYSEKGKVIQGASENLKKLKNDGHKLYIITARWLANIETHELFEGNVGERMRNIVRQWLKENDIIYDEIIFSGHNKSKYILEKNIDVMIEDSPKNIEELHKYTKIICMDWEYNRKIDDNICYRCYNWNEIYDVIKRINDNKLNKN